eukprot:Gb_24819 [translate_table: standard]
MPIQTMDQSLNRWFIEMPKIRSCLSGLLTKHHSLWIDQPECINHNLSLHTLNGINHHSNCSLIQGFKTLLCIDINTRKPASKTRM